MAGNCSKDGVAEFMQVFGMHAPSIDISGETAPTDYVVYTANIRVLEGNFANLAYTITGAAGSVNSWNGIPVFYPTNS